MSARILLLDDDRYARELFQGLVRKGSWKVTATASVAEARAAYHAGDFNLVILDQRLPDGNGLQLFTEMRAVRPRQVAILITAYADFRDAVKAVKEGFFDYLTKPFQDLEELEAVIGKALEMDRAYREIDELRNTLDERQGQPALIFRSTAIGNLLAMVRQVAPLDTTVLIEGESGVGKELIARKLHASSARADGPLLEVNCGALTESLLEATLFGYERGAFTNAAKTTPGYFESADRGTLFLDEIADMSPKLQASLLRVLQERSFARLGSTTQRTSNFRLMCATNKNLEAEIQAGRFRTDLFYRINVVAMRVPPLRERAEDISALALYFLGLYSDKFGKAQQPFTAEAMAALEAHPWPGNVRELQHAVERAVAVNEGTPITPRHLNLAEAPEPVPAEDAEALLPFREARKRFERHYFTTVLDAAQGNVSEAARLSGVARQNLHARISKLRSS